MTNRYRFFVHYYVILFIDVILILFVRINIRQKRQTSPAIPRAAHFPVDKL